MNKGLLVILSLFLPSALSAQQIYYSQRMIDSLKRIVVTLPDDTAKVSMLNTLARATAVIGQGPIARTYAGQALAVSTALRWKPGIAMAHNRIGNTYDGMQDSARFHYSMALNLWQELGDKRNLAVVYSNLSGLSRDTAQTLRYALQSLKYAEESGDSTALSRARFSLMMYYFKKNDLPNALLHCDHLLLAMSSNDETLTAMTRLDVAGVVYMRQHAYSKALKCYFKSLTIATLYADTMQAVKSRTAQIYANMGVVYLYLKQYNKSLEYHHRALALREEMKDTSGAVSVMTTICELYKMLPDNARTLDYCNKTLQVLTTIHKNKTVWEKVIVYCTIAEVHRKQKQYEAAIFFGNAAFTMARQLGEETELSYTQKELGLCLLALALDSTNARPKDHHDSTAYRAAFEAFVPIAKTARLHLAQSYLVQSLGIASNSTFGLNEVAEECYIGLITITKLLGDFKSTALYYDKYLNLKDSTFSVENNNSISILEMQQAEENLKKQEHIASLELEKMTNEKRLTIAVLGFVVILTLILYNRFRLKKKANIALEEKNQIISEEKEKSDTLLLNILPAEVAEELKAKGTADAKLFDNVTVLFTDFKSFTTVSEQLSPQELVNELHACFKAFDEICGKYSIEKIKTIGDAYLAVCGLPQANEQHAENVVNAALEIREFMANRSKEMGAKTFEIRIGINSGSVVAGIVGVKKFAYDIWGDTVNTAARMEQHSEAGKINISETTYALVKNQFTCEYRGEIDAKNKGKLAMYFVESIE
ncbi:MAG: adenylate/guanylate cyclase domain-containing protein [Candidatus Kapaibacterium sp.]